MAKTQEKDEATHLETDRSEDSAAPKQGKTNYRDSEHVTWKGAFASAYALFYNKKVGLALILAAGVLALLGIIFPQAPDGVFANPDSKAAWLNGPREVYGGWTGILAFLGFFNMFSSPLFLTVLILLALSIVACTTHRLPLLWRKAFRPHISVTDAFFDQARYRSETETNLDPQTAYARILEALRRRHWRVLPNENTAHSAYVDRFHYGPFGTVFAHLAFILIMAGFLVSGFFGFRNDAFNLTVGYPQPVGFNTGLSAEAKSFTDSYYPDGSPKDYVTDLVLSRNGKTVARQNIRVNSPLTLDGIMFHQASFGISGVVSVRDSAGKTVFRGGVPMLYDLSEQGCVYGTVTLPGQNLELFVMMPASGQQPSGIAPGQARLEVYPAGKQDTIGVKVLNQGDSAKIGELNYVFEREAQYTGVLVKKDPGTVIVWVGSGFLIVGTFMTMLLRHRRFWLRLESCDGKTLIRLASHDKLDTAFERQFDAMTRYLANELNTQEE